MKYIRTVGSNQYQSTYRNEEFRPKAKKPARREDHTVRTLSLIAAVIFIAGFFAKHDADIHAFFAPPAQATGIISPLASDSAKLSQPTPTPTPTERDIVNSYPHADIVWRIYGLESSFGHEPFLYCQRQGKINTMGFNVLNHQCFASFEEQVKTVSKWVSDHGDMKLGAMLCYYNTGKTSGCEYEKNFLSL